MRLASPEWLGLVPVVLILLWLRLRGRRRPTVLYSSVAVLRSLPRTVAQRIRRVLPFLEAAGLLLLILAMARPQSGRQERFFSTRGVAISIVVDKSGSMRETDLDPDPFDRVTPSRLDVVKAVVADFVDEAGDLPGRPDDLVGLLSFAGFVQTHSPLTLDHEAFVKVLDTVRIPRVDRRDPRARELMATAMGDAMVIAVERLRGVEARSKVIVLVTDGRSNIGDAPPELAAEAAKAAGVKIYAIGVGTRRGGLDEETLQTVARISEGRYFNARDAAGILEVYREIDALEKSDLPAQVSTRWRERYHVPLLLGLVLLVGHHLLLCTRFRSLP